MSSAKKKELNPVLRRLLDLHLELVEEVEHELTPKTRRRSQPSRGKSR
jgi:hypothetical protein